MPFWSFIADIISALVAGSGISPARKVLVQAGLEMLREAERRQEEAERLAEIPPIEGTMMIRIEIPKKEEGDS